MRICLLLNLCCLATIDIYAAEFVTKASAGYRIVPKDKISFVEIEYCSHADDLAERAKELRARAFTEEEIREKLSGSKEDGGFALISSSYSEIIVMGLDGKVQVRSSERNGATSIAALPTFQKGVIIRMVNPTAREFAEFAIMRDGELAPFEREEKSRMAAAAEAMQIANARVRIKSAPADANKIAISVFPQLAVAGSPLNVEFVARHKHYQSEKPAYFRDPAWPLNLAKECSDVVSTKAGESAK